MLVEEFMKYVMIADEKCSIHVDNEEIEQGWFDDTDIRAKYGEYKVELITYNEMLEKWMLYFKK